MSRTVCLNLTLLLALLLSVSCTHTDFNRLSRTDYIQHYKENKNPHIPFICYWSKMHDEQWDNMVQKEVPIYIPPVSLNWYVNMPDTATGRMAIEDLRAYFDKRIRDEIRKMDEKDDSFHLVNAPGPGVYTLDYAIL